MKKSIIVIAVLLVYGVLCALGGGVVVCVRARRPPNAGLLDPGDLIAMNALRAGHRAEFLRLRTAETAQMAGRRPAPGQPGRPGRPGQDGDGRA